MKQEKVQASHLFDEERRPKFDTTLTFFSITVCCICIVNG